MSRPEKSALLTFGEFLVTPGEMLCFHGPGLEKHTAALKTLTAKKLLVKERFKGGYSLTREGFVALKECE